MVEAQHKDELGKILRDRFGKEIEEAEVRFSGNHYFFNYNSDNTTIRISPQKGEKELMARTIWADDLRAFKDTICESTPSKYNHIIERFTFMKRDFVAQMYKLPKGRMTKLDDIKPMYMICEGDVLGNIHKASMEQGQIGMKFQIPRIDDHYFGGENPGYDLLTNEQRDKIEYLKKQINAIDTVPEKYGVCFGDFSLNNQMIDANNIYLFDFDSSMYGYYMYDIAVLFRSILLSGYMKDTPARTVVEKHLLPWFMIGYSINKHCEKKDWEELEVFLSYVSATAMMDMYDRGKIDESGMSRRNHLRHIYSMIFMADNVYDGIDAAKEYAKVNGLGRVK